MKHQTRNHLSFVYIFALGAMTTLLVANSVAACTPIAPSGNMSAGDSLFNFIASGVMYLIFIWPILIFPFLLKKRKKYLDRTVYRLLLTNFLILCVCGLWFVARDLFFYLQMTASCTKIYTLAPFIPFNFRDIVSPLVAIITATITVFSTIYLFFKTPTDRV